MIAAIYARKSTEQDVSDDAKSVVRQVGLARAFAAERGWTVAEEYVDDGISGALASKLVNRARLLAAATEGKFSAVIVRDYDRLSRDDREGPGFIYALEDCGVEIWYYADRSRVYSAHGADARDVVHEGDLRGGGARGRPVSDARGAPEQGAAGLRGRRTRRLPGTSVRAITSSARSSRRKRPPSAASSRRSPKGAASPSSRRG